MIAVGIGGILLLIVALVVRNSRRWQRPLADSALSTGGAVLLVVYAASVPDLVFVILNAIYAAFGIAAILLHAGDG